MGGNLLNALDVSAPTQDLMFMLASNVNVSNFVTVKLYGQSNYHIWSAQMLCLLESQMLRGVVEDNFPLPEGMDSNMIKRYDTLIKGWIFGSTDESLLKNFVQFESARDLWRDLEFYNSIQVYRTTEVTSRGFMFRAKSVSGQKIECTEHEKRKMKLYEATIEGRWRKAKSILKNNEEAATEAISENGNTMLHLAVEMGHNYFVEQLLMLLRNGSDVEKRNLDGRTALHAAAMVDNSYAAELLVQKREQLLRIRDNKGQSPLDIASNNSKLNTYAYLLRITPPSSGLIGYQEVTKIEFIVTLIKAKQYDLASIVLHEYPELASRNDEILMIMATTFPTDLGSIESLIYPSLNNVRQNILIRGSLLFDCDILYKCVGDISRAGKIFLILLVPIATFYPLYKLICLLILVFRFPVSVFYYLLWKVLAVIVNPVKNIEKKKKEYKEAKKILSLICDQISTSRFCYDRPILEAVRQDAYQVVDEILYHEPNAINCCDEQGHNVVQLAIINRSEKVYNLIYHIIERVESYRTMKDSSMNNLIHMAGRLAPSFVLDRTTGAALQLQYELLWREEVENLLSPLAMKEDNLYGETPEMVFDREHVDLVKKGENWAKTTAESCSITAALNVTIAFAAAITVPRGSNQESGIPVFKKKFAFAIFGTSNAFSLFTSVTALLMFLSVITTGYSEKVFRISLPRRLIFGLITLFLSTTAMIVAFGAILFLVFCDQRPWMLAPLFAFACLPISVIVTVKLPLMVSLMRSTYFPIFGKKSYLSHCKTNRKNTIFFAERINSDIEGRLVD